MSILLQIARHMKVSNFQVVTWWNTPDIQPIFVTDTGLPIHLKFDNESKAICPCKIVTCNICNTCQLHITDPCNDRPSYMDAYWIIFVFVNFSACYGGMTLTNTLLKKESECNYKLTWGCHPVNFTSWCRFLLSTKPLICANSSKSFKVPKSIY